jgi:hypothetical protein
MTLTDQLDRHPAVAVLLNFREPFRNGTRSNLRNHTIEIDEAQWNPNEAADLPHAIALSFDETESRNRPLR